MLPIVEGVLDAGLKLPREELRAGRCLKSVVLAMVDGVPGGVSWLLRDCEPLPNLLQRDCQNSCSVGLRGDGLLGDGAAVPNKSGTLGTIRSSQEARCGTLSKLLKHCGHWDSPVRDAVDAVPEESGGNMGTWRSALGASCGSKAKAPSESE